MADGVEAMAAATEGQFDMGEMQRVHLTVKDGRIFLQAEGESRYTQAFANEVDIEANRVRWVLDGRDIARPSQHVWSDKALANISLVQEAIDRWRLQNDPASDEVLTMAEYIVVVLDQERRLR